MDPSPNGVSILATLKDDRRRAVVANKRRIPVHATVAVEGKGTGDVIDFLEWDVEKKTFRQTAVNSNAAGKFKVTLKPVSLSLLRVRSDRPVESGRNSLR